MPVRQFTHISFTQDGVYANINDKAGIYGHDELLKLLDTSQMKVMDIQLSITGIHSPAALQETVDKFMAIINHPNFIVDYEGFLEWKKEMQDEHEIAMADMHKALRGRPLHKPRASAPKVEYKPYVAPEGNWVCPSCGCDYKPENVKDEWKDRGMCEACS